MASATTYSTQRTNERAEPPVLHEKQSYKYRIPWDYTIADAALTGGSGVEDQVEICTIPGGCKVLLAESFMKVSADTGTTSSIDVGYAAYTDKNGDTVAADPDGLINGFLSGNTLNYQLNDATQAPYGAKADVHGVCDFHDAQGDVTIKLKCLDSGGTFDGGIGDVWSGYFTVEI